MNHRERERERDRYEESENKMIAFINNSNSFFIFNLLKYLIGKSCILLDVL